MPDELYCSVCKAYHPTAEFYADKSKKRGYSYVCREQSRITAIRYADPKKSKYDYPPGIWECARCHEEKRDNEFRYVKKANGKLYRTWCFPCWRDWREERKKCAATKD